MQRDEPVALGMALPGLVVSVYGSADALRRHQKVGIWGHRTGHMVMLDVGGSMMFQACFVLIPTNVRMIRWSQGIVFGFLRGLNHRPSRFVAICRISLGTAKAKYPQAIDFERYLTRSHTESALDAPPTP